MVMIIESLDVVVFIELLSSYLNVVLPLSRDYVNHVCILGKLAYSMLFHPIFLTFTLILKLYFRIKIG